MKSTNLSWFIAILLKRVETDTLSYFSKNYILFLEKE